MALIRVGGVLQHAIGFRATHPWRGPPSQAMYSRPDELVKRAIGLAARPEWQGHVWKESVQALARYRVLCRQERVAINALHG